MYGTGEVLKGVSWEVKSGDRIGLVGANGSGKSTQLRIIAGLEEPTSGQVVQPADLHIAYLQQEFNLNEQRTVREELFQAFGEAAAIVNRQAVVEQAMATADAEQLETLIAELGVLQQRFEALDGYGLEARIERILPTVGFAAADGERRVQEFSGGWQMRIGLAKVMLQSPDLLLLDEPTNHLDLAAVEWLERYLLQQDTPMVVVSHDRAFIDRVCNRIVETCHGVARTYLGNYSDFVTQKQLEREVQQAAHDRQQKELAVQQAFVDRFRASATRSTQAKSRERALGKVERVEAVASDGVSISFRFPPAPRSGRQVALATGLTHGYGDTILFLDAALEVERGDRIAFVGPNGAGKSTLLRLLMGLEQPEHGSAGLGRHNVIPGYFAQNQAEALDFTTSVINTIHNVVPDWTQTEVRQLLGSFSFRQSAVFKTAGQLSGGEKARLALARMLLTPCNLLVLDEPTNHLDIPARHVLEQALQHYEGAALIVSHDRYFVSQVANRVVELRNGELVLYRGDYAYYREKKEEEQRAAAAAERAGAARAKAAQKKAKAAARAAARKASRKQT